MGETTDEGFPYTTQSGKELLSRTKPGEDGKRRGGRWGTALLCDGPSRSRPGWVCERIAVKDRLFCKRHGGRVRSGIGHGRFTTGRYSRVIPERYKAAFKAAITSRDLSDLRGELALVEARIVELGEQLSRAESGKLWEKLSAARLAAIEASSRMRAADAMKDAVAKAKAQSEQGAALAEMFRLVEQGGRDIEVWSDLLDTIERKRRLAETQTKKIISEKAYVTLDVFAATMVHVGRIIRDRVRDPKLVDEISASFARLLPSDADLVIEAEEIEDQ